VVLFAVTLSLLLSRGCAVVSLLFASWLGRSLLRRRLAAARSPREKKKQKRDDDIIFLNLSISLVTQLADSVAL